MNLYLKDSRNHFEKFLKGLDKNKICFEKDDNLVRGLDYYNRTVFEYLDNLKIRKIQFALDEDMTIYLKICSIRKYLL